MKIAIGADHAGVELKNELAERLRADAYEVDDLGTHSGDSVDYPDYAAAVARAVVERDDVDLGILVCGTGLGVAIAANKIRGARATTCNDLFTARMARAHNDANVLTLGSRVVGPGVAEEIVRTFVTTEFEGGRHGRRVGKIHGLESSVAPTE